MNKIAIVGLGYWGPNLVRNFCSFLPKKNVVVCDFDKDKVNEMYVRHRVESVESYTKILDDSSIDAVVLATPPVTHFVMTKHALECGKHVLVEKPLALSSKDAISLNGLAYNQNLTLMCDHTYLYNSAVIKLKELVDSDNFGDIKYINSSRVNLGRFNKSINVVWDLATHDISIINYLVGRIPKLVRATGQKGAQDFQIDNAYINLEYDNGLIANIHVSWLFPFKVRRMVVGGDKQTILWDDMLKDKKLQRYNQIFTEKSGNINCSSSDAEIIPFKEIEALQSMTKEFIQSIVEKRESHTSGEKSYDIIRILEAAQISLANNGLPILI